MKQPILEKEELILPEILQENMLEGRLIEVVDTYLLNEHIKEDEVRVLISVAFWCIQ